MDISEATDSDLLAQNFSFSRQKAKAIHGLKGILSGIIADQRLNEKEILYLDFWLKSQQYLADDEDVLAILRQVGDILEDGQIQQEELNMMEAWIEGVVEQIGAGITNAVAQIDELNGFLVGVAADGVLNDKEVHAISAWLDSNESVHDSWPASVIVNRLATILEDGVVSVEERDDLLLTINNVTGINSPQTAVNYQASTEFWEDKLDALAIEGSTFCLTADFVSGTRNDMDSRLRALGAKTSSNVTRHVDYLVIGTLARRDWLYSSHGRKIEKVILLQREGVKIMIVTERTLLKLLRELA